MMMRKRGRGEGDESPFECYFCRQSSLSTCLEQCKISENVLDYTMEAKFPPAFTRCSAYRALCPEPVFHTWHRHLKIFHGRCVNAYYPR